MQIHIRNSRQRAGFTLAEMVVCFLIVALTMGGVITAYTNSAYFSARAGYQLAAQGQAVQVLERVRAATWDTQSFPAIDNTTNFPATNIAIMELPITGTNVVWATNYCTVSTINVSANPPVNIKMIQVDTYWPWKGRTFSNVIVAYRAPDQ